MHRDQVGARAHIVNTTQRIGGGLGVTVLAAAQVEATPAVTHLSSGRSEVAALRRDVRAGQRATRLDNERAVRPHWLPVRGDEPQLVARYAALVFFVLRTGWWPSSRRP